MKDQYFGDVNDYRKYGLLRVLLSGGELNLLVAWMLTPDDGGADGGMRDYLGQPERWRSFDPELFDSLASLLPHEVQPRVALMEGSPILRVRYFSQLVPDQLPARQEWGERLAAEADRADLVFLDPDNGIEIQSTPVGRKGSSKFVLWREIDRLWRAGSSILVYQHFCHKPRVRFIKELASELQERTAASCIEAFRTANVLFLLAGQPRHERILRRSIQHGLPNWKGQVDRIARAELRPDDS